jgi:glutamyl-tRNA synthetase
MSNKVVTRFAPSPTGKFHAGSYRTALFAYLYARQNNGRFILRIEDTDKARSTSEFEQNIYESLEWMGLDFDAKYKQSERINIYQKYIERLIESNHAYISNEETSVSENNQNKTVIRFKNPNKKVIFNDIIRGKVEFDTTELGDFVIAKSMTEPIFHLANVIDDFEMGITHIIRGEDHISNTPRQILIFEALNAKIPCYAHIPLLLSTERAKLSKRHGAKAITEYKEMGYLPEALINYFALLGWHPRDDRELFSKNELIEQFDLERVQKGGAIFDEDKLAWFNREYIKSLEISRFKDLAMSYIDEKYKDRFDITISELVKTKISCFSEINNLFSNGELSFIFNISSYEKDLLVWMKGGTLESALKHLKALFDIIKNSNENVFSSTESIKLAIWDYVEQNGKGDVLWPFRISLTGLQKSPDPFVSAKILGKDEVLKRLIIAIDKIQNVK